MESTYGGGITLDLLQQQTGRFAVYANSYPHRQDQQVILARGLVEEGMEVLGVDKHCSDPLAAYEAAENQPPDAKELGDLFFYISEICRIEGVGQAALMGASPNLRTWQLNDDRDIVPIISPVSGERLQIEDDPRSVLAIAIMRVVDVMFPTELSLWHGVEQRPDLARALGDVSRAAMYLASKHEINIEEAFGATVAKLEARQREPGVMGEARRLNGSLSPDPKRLGFAALSFSDMAARAA